MKGLLNDLEKKLHKDDELCQLVANIIEIIANSKYSNKQKELLINEGLEYIAEKLQLGSKYLAPNSEQIKIDRADRKAAEYLYKIKQTILYCANNYKNYKKTHYYSWYYDLPNYAELAQSPDYY